jgi:hypothetical protein
METAKVDIRKLQLLNDRIAQCFEALNDVRLSVHAVQGLSHTSALDPRTANVYGSVQGSPFGVGYVPVSPFQPFQTVLPYQQMTTPFLGSQAYIPGTAPTIASQASAIGANPVGTWDPRLDPRFAASMVTPLGVQPLTSNPLIGIGLSHTSADPIDPYNRFAWSDPILAARVVQTFPYATFAFLPFVRTI